MSEVWSRIKRSGGGDGTERSSLERSSSPSTRYLDFSRPPQTDLYCTETVTLARATRLRTALRRSFALDLTPPLPSLHLEEPLYNERETYIARKDQGTRTRRRSVPTSASDILTRIHQTRDRLVKERQRENLYHDWSRSQRRFWYQGELPTSLRERNDVSKLTFFRSQ